MSAVLDGQLPAIQKHSCRLGSDGRSLIEAVLGEKRLYPVRGLVHEGRTAFQHVLIVDTVSYGRMLVIDGEVQSAEDDEYQYHESLVHPAMLAHPAPRDVLIVGGGEGATLREVLRHQSVAKATMVDIDGELIALARDHLGAWHRGAYDDPRTELHIADGLAFVAQAHARYDVAVIDVCDYIIGTAAASIYTPHFFASLRRALRPDGILVVQAGELGIGDWDNHLELRRLVAASFGQSVTCTTYIDSFWSEWSFILAGAAAPQAAHWDAASVNAALERRGLTGRLEFYDGGTHVRMFSLPKETREALRDGA